MPVEIGWMIQSKRCLFSEASHFCANGYI